jgi:putative membrane protein
MKTTIVIAALALALAQSANADNATDQDFVTKAAQGGLTEVELGRIAEEHASAADVKQFGQHMVDDHGKANAELAAIASKAGATVPAEKSAAQQKTVDDLQKKQGAEFDAAYANAMVKDHVEDIALFKKEAASGKNADIKAFAAKTLPTLESHLKMAQALNAAK